jgi:hypothetical protein
MAKSQEKLASRETYRLIAADKVEGTEVRNAAGEKLGTIDNVMIDKLTGKVAYAVMSFGGFLGMGNKYHPVPWGALKYDTSLGAYALNMDKELLKAAPTFDDEGMVNWEDEAWGRKVHDYYKIAPYW